MQMNEIVLMDMSRDETEDFTRTREHRYEEPMVPPKP
jgi:hypothetical protein